MWDTGGKVSYTFPSCVHVDFPASDANPANSPLAEFCVPCVPSGTGGTLLSQPSHKTTQAPWLPPVGPVWQNKPWLVPGETLGYEVPVFSFRKSTGFLRPVRACVGSLHPRWGNDPPRPDRGRFGPHRDEFGRSHRRSREAGKPFSFFCFSQAGNKTHRSLKPTHSSLLGRASRAPARRCRSAQKAGRSRLPARSARGGPHRGPSPLHPLCRKERSL